MGPIALSSAASRDVTCRVIPFDSSADPGHVLLSFEKPVDGLWTAQVIFAFTPEELAQLLVHLRAAARFCDRLDGDPDPSDVPWTSAREAEQAT